jgi:hypothetical protein
MEKEPKPNNSITESQREELRSLRKDQTSGNWNEEKRSRLLELQRIEQGEKESPGRGNLTYKEFEEYLELTKEQSSSRPDQWTDDQAQRLQYLEGVRSGEAERIDKEAA